VLIPDLAEDGRFREHFLREAQIAASLDEPHIVPTLAMGEHDAGTVDGGGNRASGNATPPPCVHLICSGG
jgi:serine/threonine protein kinase